ncbi:MAG: methyltransferase domain-containing protein [Gemmatimonadota bacterium]|nr:methyltransferase domain-containing protein [Gemmatimonadota bacterium]
MFQDPKLYQAKHHYVTAAGVDLVEVLAPQVGERVLDLGCGTGQLSAQIAAAGAEVVGIDSSAEMVEAACEQFPDLSFIVGDARDFSFGEPFDAVFSNAALHWVKPPEEALVCIAACLRQGARFVAELGGARNVATISRTLIDQLADRGFHPQSPWYFPRLGEYTRLVEQAGLRVAYASHFPRPTPLEGESGLRDWMEMFAETLTEGVPSSMREELWKAVENAVRPALYGDGGWHADYWRLRVVAYKE